MQTEGKKINCVAFYRLHAVVSWNVNSKRHNEP